MTVRQMNISLKEKGALLQCLQTNCEHQAKVTLATYNVVLENCERKETELRLHSRQTVLEAPMEFRKGPMILF